MGRNTAHIVLAFLTCSLLLLSCERGFEETNMDPNSSVHVVPAALFAQAQHKYHTDYFNGVLTGIWGLNSWMQVQSNLNGIASPGDEYFISGDALDNSWRLAYADVLGNLNEAIRLTEGDPLRVHERNIYRIYRVYVFHRLTDLWGDIPYFDALNVINDDNDPQFTPAYDAQQLIYADMISELRAVASEGPFIGQNNIGSQDWIYHGDINQWIRFANSLCLRLALRIQGAAPELSDNTITALLSENRFIESNEGSAQFPHSLAARSPFYELHNTGQGMYNPSQFLVETFEATDDPRLIQYANHSPESEIFGTFQFVGVPSFMISSSIDTDEWNDFKVSYVGDYFLNAALDFDLLSYAESEFLLAEAAVHGYNTPSSAGSHLENGVRAHMDQLEIDAVEINQYVFNGLNQSPSIEDIAVEKWKTLVYTDPVELYSEWRRTGFPILINESGGLVDAMDVPHRFAYPAIEIALNPEQVAAVGHGINDFDTPVWWDVN